MKVYYRISIYGQCSITTAGGFDTMLDAYEHLATMDEAFIEGVRSVTIEPYRA